MPLPGGSGCSLAPPPHFPSPAPAAFPGAFPTYPQPSEDFPDLPQEVFHYLLPTPGQKHDFILTLLQAVRRQDQGHV